MPSHNIYLFKTFYPYITINVFISSGEMQPIQVLHKIIEEEHSLKCCTGGLLLLQFTIVSSCLWAYNYTSLLPFYFQELMLLNDQKSHCYDQTREFLQTISLTSSSPCINYLLVQDSAHNCPPIIIILPTTTFAKISKSHIWARLVIFIFLDICRKVDMVNYDCVEVGWKVEPGQVLGPEVTI